MREEKLRELYNLCDSLQRLLDETYTGEKRRLRFKRPQETKTLQQIAQTIKECHKCDLGKTRTKSVPGEGFENARLLVVGEGPGRDEDTSGRPFVGQAGNYFETWMKAINFSRDRDYFITNIVKCRPPENRNPLPEEIATCFPYLKEQIKLIKPKVILCLGKVAAHALLDLEAPLKAMRLGAYDYQGIPVVVTYHPAAVLRNFDLRGAVWQDIKKVVALLEDTGR